MTERPSPEELAAVGAPIHYTPAEAAGILDPSGKTTAYWMLKRARRGEFPCTRVARSIVFSPANLAEIARSLNQPSRPRAAVASAGRPRGGKGKAPGGQAKTSRAKSAAA